MCQIIIVIIHITTDIISNLRDGCLGLSELILTLTDCSCGSMNSSSLSDAYPAYPRGTRKATASNNCETYTVFGPGNNSGGKSWISKLATANASSMGDKYNMYLVDDSGDIES